ncbi:MAG: sterol desaturase family protein [Cyclobacteriaceae bacterium]|nr:sterol desaturase family protein [Cyclobacteriaceae bacterium]MCH8515428.1 sterol desaturase family protein [Cyclobacteriaceae bacterium]
MWTNILITIGAFIGMEMASWAIHKYLMHGPLWNIHKTHHTKNEGYFELNDIFSVFFGSCAIAGIYFGVADFSWPFFVGLGISIYGLAYFILHDMMIHRRVKAFSRPKNTYLRGIADAHRDHHKSRFRDDSVCFGLFVVPMKYFNSKTHD